MAKKRALAGLKGIVLAKVTTNTPTEYVAAVGDIDLPYAGKLNRTPVEKKQPVYYDDDLYKQINSYEGDEVEIRLAEVAMEHLQKLKLGVYNEETGVFEGEFAPAADDYSLRCITNTVDDAPYYWKWRLFELIGIRFDNFATKGDGLAVCEVILTGVFKRPKMAAAKPYAIMPLKDDGSNAAACEEFRTGEEILPAA